MCKVSGEIIGITQTNTARDRFCTTWSERSNTAYETKNLYGQNKNNDAISARKDEFPSRVSLDEKSVQQVEDQFERFNVFKLSSVD